MQGLLLCVVLEGQHLFGGNANKLNPHFSQMNLVVTAALLAAAALHVNLVLQAYLVATADERARRQELRTARRASPMVAPLRYDGSSSSSTRSPLPNADGSAGGAGGTDGDVEEADCRLLDPREEPVSDKTYLMYHGATRAMRRRSPRGVWPWRRAVKRSLTFVPTAWHPPPPFPKATCPTSRNSPHNEPRS